MQRNWGHKRHGLPTRGEQLLNRLGKHATQYRCNWKNGFVLQQMNEPAQATLVFTERHCTRKFGFEVAATVATAIAHQQLRTGQAVATNHALRRTHRLNGLKAFSANGNPGNVVERSAAEPAIGGEEHGENVSQEGLQRRDEDGTLLGALLSSFSF